MKYLLILALVGCLPVEDAPEVEDKAEELNQYCGGATSALAREYQALVGIFGPGKCEALGLNLYSNYTCAWTQPNGAKVRYGYAVRAVTTQPGGQVTQVALDVSKQSYPGTAYAKVGNAGCSCFSTPGCYFTVYPPGYTVPN